MDEDLDRVKIPDWQSFPGECPWCGGEPFHVTRHNGPGPGINGALTMWIECTFCGARGPRVDDGNAASLWALVALDKRR